MHRLRQRDYYIFLERALRDKSFSEIADALGIAPNTVRMAYKRMIERIRDEMRGDDDELR